jgi:hypothetical protein
MTAQNGTYREGKIKKFCIENISGNVEPTSSVIVVRSAVNWVAFAIRNEHKVSWCSVLRYDSVIALKFCGFIAVLDEPGWGDEAGVGIIN